MDIEENPTPEASPVRGTVQAPNQQGAPLARHAVKTKVPTGCDDCRAQEAFHAWRDEDLEPGFNTSIDFSVWGIPPAGKRAVIELVTASIEVPAGERARLRLFTSLGTTASNLDLVLTPQGHDSSGRDVLVATHAIRAYSDNLIEFNVNRDNAQTQGHVFICISGYLADS